MPAGNTTAYAKWTALMPVYRFYNMRTGAHFYTTSEVERASVLAAGLSAIWRNEGIAYWLNTASTDMNTPLYRFFNLKTGTHFYTISEVEKTTLLAAALSSTWRFEGVAYKVSVNPAGTPVYRFFNLKKGTHFYTISTVEKATLMVPALSTTWRFEGVSFYLAP